MIKVSNVLDIKEITVETTMKNLAQLLSHIQLFVTPWTVAHQAPLSMGFPRQEYWRGLPFPPPGDLAYQGIKPVFPAFSDGFFTTQPTGKPTRNSYRESKEKEKAFGFTVAGTLMEQAEISTI